MTATTFTVVDFAIVCIAPATALLLALGLGTLVRRGWHWLNTPRTVRNTRWAKGYGPRTPAQHIDGYTPTTDGEPRDIRDISEDGVLWRTLLAPTPTSEQVASTLVSGWQRWDAEMRRERGGEAHS